ncbi:allantoinase AllB [Microbacterium sp. SA39]|uniref:allantoinase AllB n=1 Tax=Microbacterium sp. SA39 TaxID=1263625 RepID=UPI00061F43E5|nr:allantoinase AllB [Microbacterium sp. SA39]KJQ52763.1 Allantoinase [Microbacterium sp. SA39]
MRLIVAPDKFKGSLTAPEVADRFASGARRADPSIEVIAIPVADGGEGTLDAALAAGYESRSASVAGPTGVTIEAAFAVRDGEAVIEMARASGLDLLPEGRKDPLGATSLGTGQLISAALNAGCRRIVVGIGGSACTDGGAGLLVGLGARLLDESDVELPLGGALTALARVDLSGLDDRLTDAEIILASDVDNPLVGRRGAAVVFGPQKGASPADVAELDAGLGRLVTVLDAADGLPVTASTAAAAEGAGAAGGVGFAAIALGATRLPGIDVVLEFTGLADRLHGADAVITGEGSLDEQSLMGKTPIGVARSAAVAAVPVYAVCGRTTLSPTQIAEAGFAGVRALSEIEPDPARSIENAGELLEQLAEDLVRSLTTASPEDRFDLVLRGRALVDGSFADVEIGVREGLIARIAPQGLGLDAQQIVELAADEVLLPGLVDTHVHVNEPGRTEWEGFESATRAAAAGGVTTIVDMPLNSIPPTVSVEALAVKRAVAEGRVFVDVGFWGGVIPGNIDELAPLHDEGVYGFKCFLLPSGVDEFPDVSVDEMREAMGVLAELDSLLVVHAEDAHIIEDSIQPGSREYAPFLASRPRSAEDAAIAEVIRGAADTGVRAHVLHLSNADSLGRIAAARADGVDLTVETCPHYLTLAAEDIPDGSTAFKCCPPIREEDNRDELWGGLAAGTIDFVVSDHSPSTPELKFAGDGDFSVAWGGIASLQLGLPLIWTEGRRRGLTLEHVVSLMSEKPAARVGLEGKGRIADGFAADFAVFAPEQTFRVDAAALAHRHPITPYDGRELSGVVRTTYLAGVPVTADVPRGRLLRRSRVEIGART